MLIHHVEQPHGDGKADLAAAVETAMDLLAAEIGPEWEIGGAAVAYRDAAERRAIVTRLASGQWHTASLVSTKSAHLNVAGALTWLAEFDDLLLAEVVPGYQAFTLVDRGRSRVLAATAQTGGATPDSLGVAVTAAWDQFDAAAVRPDAVVLIGSGAADRAVLAAVDDFGAPVIPCKLAASATAIGAALAALAQVDEFGVPMERVRHGRGVAALFTAASVLAGGLIAGGVYLASSSSRSGTGAVLADARVTADARTVEDGVPSGSSTGSSAGAQLTPEGTGSGRQPSYGPGSGPTVPDPLVEDVSWDLPNTTQRWGSGDDGAMPLVAVEPLPETATAAPPHQTSLGSGTPGVTTKIGAPNAALLFPGETAPPAAFTPESYTWWDEHFHMLLQWAAQQLIPT